ncbi:hypothetical protein QYM36_018981, partial [Artemia franciscana]
IDPNMTSKKSKDIGGLEIPSLEIYTAYIRQRLFKSSKYLFDLPLCYRSTMGIVKFKVDGPEVRVSPDEQFLILAAELEGAGILKQSSEWLVISPPAWLPLILLALEVETAFELFASLELHHQLLLVP